MTGRIVKKAIGLKVWSISKINDLSTICTLFDIGLKVMVNIKNE